MIISCAYEHLSLDIPPRLAVGSLRMSQILVQDMTQITRAFEVNYHDHFVHDFLC